VGIDTVSQPAVSLDCDRVLVEEAQSGEWEASWRPDNVRLIPGATQAARALRLQTRSDLQSGCLRQR
jgi:hypothetical protein